MKMIEVMFKYVFGINKIFNYFFYKQNIEDELNKIK